MPKKFLESLFVIDANEKPAPSFLTAYIFTWLVYHNQTITTFIATDADFFTRLNMAIGAVGDNRYGAVFIITCVLVFGRFALNNSLYICREWLDNKTQGWLTENGYKSFISDRIHQQTLDSLASTRAELHSFHDRAMAAEEIGSNIKKELQKLKNDSEVKHQDDLHSIKEKEIEIDKLTKLNESSLKQLQDSNDEQIPLYDKINHLQNKNDELSQQFSTSFNESQAKQIIIEKYIDDLESTKDSVNMWKNTYEIVKKKIDIWSENTNTDELKLLYKNDEEYTTSDRTIFSLLLNTKIDFPEGSAPPAIIGRSLRSPSPVSAADLKALSRLKS